MNLGQSIVDFDACEIKGPAGDYSIEPKVMQVLAVLVDNANEVLTRDQIIDEVWGVSYGGDERLSRAISLLRKALGDTRGQHNFIQTIPKTGYKLVLDAVSVDAGKVASKGAFTEATGVVQQHIGEHVDPGISEPLQGHSGTNKWFRIIPALTALFLALAAFWNYSQNKTQSVLPEAPLVVVMDSAHPARIYDDDIRDSGATNADILSDIMADLPVRTQKELISPSWHRFEAMKQFDPDLIVIHYSGFKQEDARGDRPQLRLLLEYFKNSDTEFLVYSRASQAWLDKAMDKVMAELYEDDPELKSRIEIFPLLEYGEPYWKDQGPAQGIKLKIKEMLDLEPDN